MRGRSPVGRVGERAVGGELDRAGLLFALGSGAYTVDGALDGAIAACAVGHR
ncbi:MAG: hypothetical protein GY941_09880 [Planctomycetes bacterium]|nr:hypothetical protein [Planctomycetota bacterium]